MSLFLVQKPLICLTPNKFIADFKNTLHHKSNFVSAGASRKPYCLRNENTHKTSEGFCVLKSDVPCDSGDVWSTMALYVFSLHIPLSFGGLSVISQILHQPVLDPETEAFSILVIQTLELVGALLLLRFTGKNQDNLLYCFQANHLSQGRNWLLASLLGFGFLVLLIFLTSFLADRLIGPKDVNNPIVKEILMSGFTSEIACVVVYCLITPLLEETIYRGFLLASLASTMKWQQAIVISASIFSAAHFSGENFWQLFIIGSVLGCSYCWTGTLCSSIVIHSLYNVLTLLITFKS